MGVDFAISESGKIAIHPIRTREAFQQLNRVTSREYKSSCSFVGEVLEALRTQVPPRATVLGFVGLPFTLASYLVEGQTGVASGFPEVRSLIDKNPKLLHDILSLLAKNIADYACYQIDCGAQVIQVFDSWAGHMDDESYNVFCAPYQKRVVASIKSHSPKTPIIIYMAPGEYSRHGRRLALLAQTGADIVSVDHTVDIGVARKILPDSIGIQGNLDPQLLRDGPLEEIESHTIAILDKMAGRRHIMNLGHGILADTPEEHAAFFVSTVQSYKQ
jgi:uroporphyrinogen decarboxylase